MCSGRRQLICTIDGDGCWNPDWMRAVQSTIKRHPNIKFTASLITAYYEGLMRASSQQVNIALAEQLFEFDNVEPASHTFSHPNDWKNQQGRNLLNKPWNTREEVYRSLDLLRKVTDKPIETLLLTGNCRPNGGQVAVMYEAGLYPFNGGLAHELPYRLIGGLIVYNQRGRPDVNYTGIRKWTAEDGGSVPFLDNPAGYKEAIPWFKERPTWPVHVYFHFYAGEFKESIDAVDHVLTWAERQHFEPLYLSEYIAGLSAPA